MIYFPSGTQDRGMSVRCSLPITELGTHENGLPPSPVMLRGLTNCGSSKRSGHRVGRSTQARGETREINRGVRRERKALEIPRVSHYPFFHPTLPLRSLPPSQDPLSSFIT